jgi:ABC-type multidrug transport system fused ATPase/permease subunit
MTLSRSRACAERVLELIDNEMVVADAPGAVSAPPLQGRVEFRNVSFAYKSGPPVLKSLSFVAEPGQTVAVVGHSGAGKSTLVSLLLRFYDPHEGTFLVDGHDVRGLTRKSLREQITVVLQDARLLRQSVAENIGFGRKGASAQEIVEAAQQAEADEFITRMPDAYATVLAEAGDNLSGGEKQRIHIARAMLRRTPIVILDEPVSGLDPVAEAKIQNAVHRLTRGRTTFIIAHKMATLAHADTILVLENGSIAEQGTHEQMLRASPAYRELCELQNGREPVALSGNGAGEAERAAVPGPAGGSR